MADDRTVAFRDALAAENHAEAIAGFDGFAGVIDDRELREGSVRNLARAIINRTASDEAANEAAKAYVTALAEAENARNQARLEFLMYLQDGPSGPSVAETVDDVIAAHEAIDDAEETMRQARGDVSLPPMVVVAGGAQQEVAVDEQLTVTYEVENVGTAEVSDVSLDVEGLDASISPGSVDALAPDEAVTATVTATPEEAQSANLRVEAAAENAGETRQTPVHVLDAGDYVERAHQSTEESRDSLEDRIENSDDPHESLDGVEAKLAEVDERLEEVEELLAGDGNANAARGRIGSVINLLGAIINQVEALRGKHLSEQFASTTIHNAEQAIDLLTQARDLLGGGGNGKGGKDGGKGGGT